MSAPVCSGDSLEKRTKGKEIKVKSPSNSFRVSPILMSVSATSALNNWRAAAAAVACSVFSMWISSKNIQVNLKK